MAELKKQYKEFKKLFADKDSIVLTHEDEIRYQDMISLLKERDYILYIEADQASFCRLNLPWTEIDKWINNTAKENKRLNRREWAIAIVSTIIGALIGLIPTIVSLFSK